MSAASTGAAAFDVGDDGRVTPAVFIPSPNCDERPPGASVRLVVVHGISLPPGEFGGPGIVELFTNRLDPAGHPYYATIADLRVSAHFLIRRDGALLQFVPLTQRAWHAGASCWCGVERCNDFSIGIELEGSDDEPYADAQYATLLPLLGGVAAVGGVFAIKQDGSGVGKFQAGDDAQERGLAGAGRAQQRHQLARGNLQADVLVIGRLLRRA